MKRTTINLHTHLTAAVADRRRQLSARREHGGISVEYVVIAVGLFALATLVIGLITTWASGKLASLT